MMKIRIFYTDGGSETVNVVDYSCTDGWLSYYVSSTVYKPVSIPTSMIRRVERL